MKIRTGFVSNSSSSSFLVIFPYAPTSKEDVKDILFGEGYTMDELWDGNKIEDLSRRIFEDCKKSATDRSIADMLEERLENYISFELDKEYSYAWALSVKEMCGTNSDLYTKAYLVYSDYKSKQKELDQIESRLNAQFKTIHNDEEWERGGEAYWKNWQEFMDAQPDLNAAVKVRDKIYKKAINLIKKCVKEDIKFLKKDNHNCFFLVAEYGDHEHLGATIEQCGVFRKVQYVQNNHH